VDMQAQTVTACRVEGEGEGAEIRPVAIPVEQAEPLVREQSDFLRAVRGRGNALVPGEEGRDALALAHRVLAAICEFRRAVEGVAV
ncbi:MAG: hypothetical protein ACRD00_02485, partial [Thermoanaerobaculia bacterium]